MADRRYFVDVFGEIVDTVRASYDPINPLEPYYMYGHPREIANRLDLKTRDKVEKFKKFPLIWLMTDLKESHGEAKDVLYSLDTFRVFIVTNTNKNYTSEERTANSFKPTLQPIYDALMLAINSSRAIVTNSNGVENDKYDRYAWGAASVYGNEGLIFNDWLDAIEIELTNIQVYKEVNQCQ